MPQSLSRVVVHLVFSTKHRAPLIVPEALPDLHAYMSSVLEGQGCPSIKTGGIADHVHLLFGLSRTKSIADIVEELKTSSTKWMKRRDRVSPDFRWQAGYGAFSVCQSQLNAAIRYVERQEEHHRRKTFQDEFRAFLTSHGVEYDERYVWD